MRKLVTLRKIDKLVPIARADKIELAIIGGWACIVKKGEFTEGSLGFYFEIDSWVPATDTRFAFLGSPKLYKNKEGWRIKTMKMRGAISQGLMLPTSMFPELDCINTQEDYSKELKVEKWESQEAVRTGGLLAGKTQGKFPHFIPKTDQERLQNLSHYFDIHTDTEFEETMKLDGSSITCFRVEEELPWYKKLGEKIFKMKFNHSRFGVCSRNLELQPTDDFKKEFLNGSGVTSQYHQSDFWQTALAYDLHKKIPTGFAIQAELIGPRIQNNHEKVEGLELHVYDIYNINTRKYLTPHERESMMITHLKDVPHVPVVNTAIKIFQECSDFDVFQKRVTGESINPGTISEGRVYKAVDGSFSFKLISNQYLLKEK